jgi:hypothetical protein
MKSSLILACGLVFIIPKVASADEVAPSRPAPQHAAAPPARANIRADHPSAGVRVSNANATHNRLGAQPNLYGWRNNPTLGQPTQRTPLAMNVQNPRQTYRPRPSPREPQQRQNVNVRAGTPQNVQRANNNRQSYADALRRCRHERHDCNWWKRHCRTIVFVNTGYYYLDAGYWYPAYGYDPAYDYYDYDGPIYTYGNLLPDQVITNVQIALQEAGYYLGPITGSLGPGTRAALANFQRDYGLVITGAIDQPTVESLGLI